SLPKLFGAPLRGEGVAARKGNLFHFLTRRGSSYAHGRPLRRHQVLPLPCTLPGGVEPTSFEKGVRGENFFQKDPPRIQEVSPYRVILTWRGLTSGDSRRLQTISGDFGTKSTHFFTHAQKE
ncbi:hypothetical protein, partial [Pseudodesulfovibrio aespoeensis]|uniref:hypothetical protein n=1 Tax=Pseudodesulfovibrio aespoeensis TaxID=182210 RepID=UPI002355256C